MIDWGEAASVPFREEILWRSAGAVVIGGGAAVYFLDLATGVVRHRLALPKRFGHLALDAGEPGLRDESIYVMSWTDVIAVLPSLETRWCAREIAVDGVTFDEASGNRVSFHAEMDPPGGWFAVTLDAATGRELARTPALTDDYAGIYQSDRSDRD